jgi:hypothetical protein
MKQYYFSKLKLAFYSIFLTLYCFESSAQQNVSISDVNSTPDASSVLDISSTNKGLLIPRVALAATNIGAPITLPATSMLVYNTATAGLSPNNVIPGYYYNAGTPATPNWLRMNAGSTGGTEWKLLGNSGTNASSNFLGTIDGVDLVFRTNNTEKMRIMSGGNVGIGTTTPAQKLDVIGNLQFSQALMPNGQPGTSGQVLISQGANTAPIWAAGGGPSGITVYTSGSGLYTPPAGTKSIIVQLVGAGGAGGAGNYWYSAAGQNNIVGAGGGAGGYCLGVISNVSGSYAYNVGIGGICTAAASNQVGVAGGSGSSTTFGGLFSANGGAGGISMNGSGNRYQAGGAGGTASGGLVNLVGSQGGAATSGGVTFTVNGFRLGQTGNGGASFFGSGGQGSTVMGSSVPGANGIAPGSGGSGCGADVNNQGSINTAVAPYTPFGPGGSGANGLIIIYEFN